jgi:hypothetical protein
MLIERFLLALLPTLYFVHVVGELRICDQRFEFGKPCYSMNTAVEPRGLLLDTISSFSARW